MTCGAREIVMLMIGLLGGPLLCTMVRLTIVDNVRRRAGRPPDIWRK